MAEELRNTLKQLAEEVQARSGRKLYEAAKRRGVAGVTQKAAEEVVRGDVGRQTLKQPTASGAKHASEGPGRRLQVDLLDMSQNARAESGNRYAAMLADVYTRESRAFAIPEKTPEIVNAALELAIEDLAGGKDFVITSDGGGEFARLAEILPEQASHHRKQSINGTSIVDRMMQTIKGDLAAEAARKGGDWDEHLPNAVDAYNARPHSAVFGPPEDVRLDKEQEYYVLKANADKFAQNRAASKCQVSSIRETQTVRPPLDRSGRSFNPSFGDPVAVRTVDADFVTTERGDRLLTRSVQAVPAGSARAVSRLTDPTLARRQRLRPDADRLEEYLLENGPMRLAELERQLRVNAAVPTVKRALARTRMTLRSFLRAFPQVFRVARGVVSAANDPEDQAAEKEEAPPQAAAPAPRTAFLQFLDRSREAQQTARQ